MRIKNRIKLFYRLAQEQKEQSVDPAPSIDIVSMFPYIKNMWGQNLVTTLQSIAASLNKAIHSTSGGKINFQTLKSNNFEFGSAIPANASAVKILNFIKIFCNSCLKPAMRDPNIKQLTKEEVISKIENLNQALSSSDIIRITGKDFDLSDLQSKIQSLISSAGAITT